MRFMRKAFTSPEHFLYVLSVTAPRTALDIRAAAVTAGWDQVKPLSVRIDISAAGAIYSTTAASALKYVGTIPAGSPPPYIRNAGIIYGNPGAGGAGGNTALSTSPLSGLPGVAGGTAIETNVAMSIDNTSGTIAGGAGGGGGGGGGWDNVIAECGGGGGGGGGGATYSGFNAGFGSDGGAGGTSFGAATTASTGGVIGTTVGGTGGGAGTGDDGGGVKAIGGAGGAGGLPGIAGGTGGTAALGNVMATGGLGGAAGLYISGNSYVTWLANGTRTGGIA